MKASKKLGAIQGAFHHFRQRGTGHRHPEQRALYWQAGLEPSALHQGSGRRQARLNPREAWIIEDVPELRIIDDELWQRVKERQHAIRQDMNPAGVQGAALRLKRARRPVYLSSGLLTCGCCGAGYTLINKSRHGCAVARAKGAAVCTNRATILREEVEARALEGLKAQLLHPELIAAFVDEYRRAWNEGQAGASAGRTKAQQDLAQAEKKIMGLLQAIEDGTYHPSMKAKMQELEVVRTRLLDEPGGEPGAARPALVPEPDGTLS